jgi:TonB family protein
MAVATGLMALAAVVLAQVSPQASSPQASSPQASSPPVSSTPLDQRNVVLRFSSPGTPDWMRFYPKSAQERGIEGSVDVRCRIEAQKLTECVPISEIPTGEGFGKAAVDIFSQVMVSPQAKDGTPTTHRLIVLHFDFSLSH